MEAFCSFGLLRAPETLERVVALLPEPRRKQALSAIESCASLPEAEVRRRFIGLRAGERDERRAKLPPGADAVSPAVRRWIEARQEADGREDYQS